MNDEEFYRIRHQKNFCVLPFSHLFMHSNGEVWPCAKLAPEYLVGNTSQSIEELWNSNTMKDLRLKMLKNEHIEQCHKQCQISRQPIKLHIEPEIFDLCKETISSMKSDGSCRVNFIVWHLVESNKCNFKCLYCGKGRSVLWCDDEKTMGVDVVDDELQNAYSSFDKFKYEYSKYMGIVKNIYFCAGESTFQDSYYWMMDELIRLNRTEDVKLFFMTNLSSYVYKSRNVYELLNQFKHVKLFASLDAMGNRAEYIRYGTKWDVIERNREELFKYKNIDFIIQPTMTNMNIYHFPDFHRNWYDKGFLNKDDVLYITLSTPKYFGVDVLPVKLKEEIMNKYNDYKKWIESCDDLDIYPNREHPVKKINKMLNIMNSDQDVDCINEFVTNINKMNSIRNNDFWKVFELEASFFKHS